MTVNQTIDFKDPLSITLWLDAALKKEKEKYKKCPVIPDYNPGYQDAQAWGYVVAGYFLVEEAFKALLYLRSKQVPTIHSLSTLFDLLDDKDKEILREYYIDFHATIGGNIGTFPFKTIDEFLVNLDGSQNSRGDHIGSFDWRYFPIEEKRSQSMPIVNMDYLHEIVYGSIRIIEHARNGQSDPSECTHSWRMRWEREEKYQGWLFTRMNTDDWDDLGDRLEILWGPDYRGRHDLCFFQGKRQCHCFDVLPNDIELPIVDKTEEIKKLLAQRK